MDVVPLHSLCHRQDAYNAPHHNTIKMLFDVIQWVFLVIIDIDDQCYL